LGKRIIYVPHEKEGLWERFKKACEREGTAMSKVIIKQVEKWMITHEPGNPQTAISSFAKGGKITISGIEGRVRQLCIENNVERYKDMLGLIKEQGISDGSMRTAMGERIYVWLKENGRKIYR